MFSQNTPQLLGHTGLQNMKVGEKKNLDDLPLFVRCMLTLALKTLCDVLGDRRPNEIGQHFQFVEAFSW